MSKTVMLIDTQQMVNQITAAGIAQGHAGAIASVIAGTIDRHHALLTETLCSKRDLDHAEARLSDKIAKAQNQIILWVVGAVILSLDLPDFLQRLGFA